MNTRANPSRPKIQKGKIHRIRHRWIRSAVRILNRHFEKLSLPKKKILVISLGIGITIICGNLIIQPFIGKNLSKLFPQQLEIPPVRNFPDTVFSEEDYRLLIKFKKTLDSLRKYDPYVYRQMLHGRQGLRDSIEYLIRIYAR